MRRSNDKWFKILVGFVSFLAGFALFFLIQFFISRQGGQPGRSIGHETLESRPETPGDTGQSGGETAPSSDEDRTMDSSQEDLSKTTDSEESASPEESDSRNESEPLPSTKSSQEDARGESQTKDSAAYTDPKDRKAGDHISQAEIQTFGAGAYFYTSEITDSLFERIYGRSFKIDCTIPRSSLRYLRVLHHDGKGNIKVGELMCHKDISKSLLEIFRKLYDASYPIEKMHLVDDYGADDLVSAANNNTSCFNFRISAGNSQSLSLHAYGKAIDINPLYNPYVWTDSSGNQQCDPQEGAAYMDRSQRDIPYKLEPGDLCYQLFLEYGFSWGGSWSNEKDYMHFSIK